MKLKEYNKKIEEFQDRLRESDDDWDEIYEELSSFQSAYMGKVLDEYKQTIDCPARQEIYNLLHYAVTNSQSGSSIIDVDTEDEANAIDAIIWEEIGDYLLDYQIYKEGEHWAVDCMFGGAYVPYWDGWEDILD